MTSLQPSPGAIMVHPMALSAMVITWCNDHYWKHSFPNWVTGKLSDFAGLVFFPFWVAGCVELLLALYGCRWVAHARFMRAVVSVSAVLFIAIKTWASANGLYECCIACIRTALAHPATHSIRVVNHVDPTDLIALPALLLVLWVVHVRDVAKVAAPTPHPCLPPTVAGHCQQLTAPRLRPIRGTDRTA